MEYAGNRGNGATAWTVGILCLIQLVSGACRQNTNSNDGSGRQATADTKIVTLGSFAVEVPTGWTSFSSGEAASLRRQFLEQSSQIYQQYSGSSEDPAKSVDVAAFHIEGGEAVFAIVSFTVPSHADLIPLLKSEAGDKADWGVRNGFIRKYLGLIPIDDETWSGFYIKMIGKNGNVEVSAGLEHKKLKNTIIQITLISPKAWDEAKATDSLGDILKSLVLKQK